MKKVKNRPLPVPNNNVANPRSNHRGLQPYGVETSSNFASMWWTTMSSLAGLKHGCVPIIEECVPKSHLYNGRRPTFMSKYYYVPSDPRYCGPKNALLKRKMDDKVPILVGFRRHDEELIGHIATLPILVDRERIDANEFLQRLSGSTHIEHLSLEQFGHATS